MRGSRFQKPNDANALQLMDSCAEAVMNDIRVAYGESEGCSFVFDKKCTLYKRRAFKLVSVVVSLFSATMFSCGAPTSLPQNCNTRQCSTAGRCATLTKRFFGTTCPGDRCAKPLSLNVWFLCLVDKATCRFNAARGMLCAG